jgi:hypothetical protein
VPSIIFLTSVGKDMRKIEKREPSGDFKSINRRKNTYKEELSRKTEEI